MKNTIEINGFTITIEDNDGIITIKSTFGDNEAESLTLDPAKFVNEAPEEAPEETTEELPEGEEQNESILDFEKFLDSKGEN